MQIYTITIVVTNPEITEKKLRWLLEEAGEVQTIGKEMSNVQD